jgi:[ribosomal protein S5]-alanine N-acetyltransferase
VLVLDTERLVVRDFIEDDWRMVAALSRDERVTRYQTWLRLPDDAAARRWVADGISHNNADPRRAYNTAIVLKSSGESFGWLGWGEIENTGTVSFGYGLLAEAWNRGYTTEAVRRMIEHVFADPPYTAVFATCAAANIASTRVLEKAGLALVGRWMERDDALDIEEEHVAFRLERG